MLSLRRRRLPGAVPVAAAARAASPAAVLLLQPSAARDLPRGVRVPAAAGRVHPDREHAAGQGPAGPGVHAQQRAGPRRGAAAAHGRRRRRCARGVGVRMGRLLVMICDGDRAFFSVST